MAETQMPYLLEQLRRAMTEDPRVSETNVRVTSAGGRIYLNGEVGSPERRTAAESLAREIAPNVTIQNDITVLSVTGPTVETLS